MKIFQHFETLDQWEPSLDFPWPMRVDQADYDCISPDLLRPTGPLYLRHRQPCLVSSSHISPQSGQADPPSVWSEENELLDSSTHLVNPLSLGKISPKKGNFPQNSNGWVKWRWFETDLNFSWSLNWSFALKIILAFLTNKFKIHLIQLRTYRDHKKVVKKRNLSIIV